MRFPFCRFRRDKSAIDKARAERAKAERDLEKTCAETPKYQALGRALREVREQNHLARSLTQAFRSDR